MAKYADKHHWDVNLNVGDLVYMFTETLSFGMLVISQAHPNLGWTFPYESNYLSVLHFLFSCLLSMDMFAPYILR